MTLGWPNQSDLARLISTPNVSPSGWLGLTQDVGVIEYFFVQIYSHSMANLQEQESAKSEECSYLNKCKVGLR